MPEQEVAPAISTRIITHYDSRSPIAEAYRTLRTNIEFADLPKPAKSLLVTSSRPSEGKTITVANLAITVAEVGKKVLLVDADMRRPSIHEAFGLTKEPGLTEILRGTIPWDQTLKRTPVENLDIITAGHIPPNPSELIASPGMKDLLEELTSYFDMLLFDCASVLAVTDAAILASLVDAVLLVALAEKTPREAASRAVTLLENVRAKVLGVVLNCINVKRRYGYYYYYYYYGKE